MWSEASKDWPFSLQAPGPAEMQLFCPRTLVLGFFQGYKVGLTSQAPFFPATQLQLVGSQQNTSSEAFGNLGRAVI